MAVHITRFNQFSLVYRVKDTINTRFITESWTNPLLKEKMEALDEHYPVRLYNPIIKLEGFNGVLDTPVELLHVVLLGFVKYLARGDISKLSDTNKSILIARLEAFDSSNLNVGSMKPCYMIKHIKSLVGRQFKIILQAVPFVLLNLINAERQRIWKALCKLCPLIFQTHITNMDKYITDLKRHINEFMYHLIKSTAQWVHKPKLHMLLHLPECILCFGPASLFSTEKFESFNEVVCEASVHSNRQALGRDIAMTFQNRGCLQFLMAGGIVYDRRTGTLTHVSHQVTNLFATHPLLQRSLGYNRDVINRGSAGDFPSVAQSKVREAAVEMVPEDIT
ncbi:hypothetical protein H4Q26_015117 [Puccinia striiformis f. sp. tritici PST-130]|nr:hypothetical protein Pst134EB_018239 [Puccinia striiformis f. sp. tritici]KAI9622438.1 hypothetical protein H4Q26_015117 [Puccinia striiformis f. sp. tritici PST-130]